MQWVFPFGYYHPDSGADSLFVNCQIIQLRACPRLVTALNWDGPDEKKLTQMIPQTGEDKPKTEFGGFYLNCRDKKSGVPLLTGAINNKTLWVDFNLDMKVFDTQRNSKST